MENSFEEVENLQRDIVMIMLRDLAKSILANIYNMSIYVENSCIIIMYYKYMTLYIPK